MATWTVLNHWCWVAHICASKLTIIASDSGLSPALHQAIIWTNAGILLTGYYVAMYDYRPREDENKNLILNSKNLQWIAGTKPLHRSWFTNISVIINFLCLLFRYFWCYGGASILDEVLPWWIQYDSKAVWGMWSTEAWVEAMVVIMDGIFYDLGMVAP